jgi:DNA-binding Lrp family transcriptional regulator
VHTVTLQGLDATDRCLLEKLQADGRIPNKTLAAAVGVAPSTALERVRRLVEEGYILGFHAEVAPRAMGAGLEVLASVRLRQGTEKRIEAFRQGVRALETVVAIVQLVGGAADFLLHLAVRDQEHLQETLTGLVTREEVVVVQTSIILNTERRPVPAFAVRQEL